MEIATPKTQVGSSLKQAMSPGASLRSLSQELLGSVNRQPTASPATVSSRPATTSHTETHSQASSEAHSLLISRDSELNAVRQQLSQLTVDFKYNLKLLKDRDNELERLEMELIEVKNTLSTKDTALADTRRALAERESALRDRDTRLASLEARQREATELSSRRLAEERAARDEALQSAHDEYEQRLAAAKEEAAQKITELQSKLATRLAAEEELTTTTRLLREENEALRCDIQRAESRAAEYELSAKRYSTQLEGSVAALKALESQYQSLADETQKADALRTERILSLETELESLRVAKATSAQEAQVAAAALKSQLQTAMEEAMEMKAAKQRAVTAMEDAEAASLRLRSDITDLSTRCSTLEESLRKAQEETAVARGEIERERGAKVGAERLVEIAEAARDAAREESNAAREEAERWRRRLEKTESKVDELVRCLEDEKTRLAMLDQHCNTLKQQLEKERQEHATTVATLTNDFQTTEDTYRSHIQSLQAEFIAVHERLEAAVAEQQRLEQLQNTSSSTSTASEDVVEGQDKAEETSALQKGDGDLDAAMKRREQELMQREAELKAMEEELELKRMQQLGGGTSQQHPRNDTTTTDISTGITSNNSSTSTDQEDPTKARLVADALGLENAKLRQQLAAMKLSFLDGMGSDVASPGLNNGMGASSYNWGLNNNKPSITSAVFNAGSLYRTAGRGGIDTTVPVSYNNNITAAGVQLQVPIVAPHIDNNDGIDTASNASSSQLDDNDVDSSMDKIRSYKLDSLVGGGDSGSSSQADSPRDNENEGDDADEDDALANARRQVLLAREYLRSIAERADGLQLDGGGDEQ